ncbi:unnamed protein product, partial [marine sediment metagenome]
EDYITASMLKDTNSPADEDIFTYESTGSTGEWHTPGELNLAVIVGTSSDSQVAVWTGDGTIEGAASFTYDGSNMQFTGDIGSTGTKITKGWFTDLTVSGDISASITGNAETVTLTDNENASEEDEILFAAGAAGSGDIGVEGDGDFTYNPSTGTVTATKYKVYRTSETTALNAGWWEIKTTATTGDLTGLRTVMISDAPSGDLNVRGVYGQAVVEAGKYAGILAGGLFTASNVGGTGDIDNVYVLGAHYSSGAETIVSGDFYLGYLKSQTRETDPRTVGGHDVLLGLENEAIEGTGMTMDSAIRIFGTNTGVDDFTHGIDFSDAEITTAEILLSNSETIDNTTDGRVTIGGGDLNIDTGEVYQINGTQITSSALSDRATIAMTDEVETITANWAWTGIAGNRIVSISTYSDTDAQLSKFKLRKSHQDTVGYTATVNNEDLGSVSAWGVGSDADKWDETARILFEQDGAVGANHVPGRIVFQTSTNAATPATAMTISSAQVVTFANDLADSEVSD